MFSAVDECRLPKMAAKDDGAPGKEIKPQDVDSDHKLDPKIDALVAQRLAETKKARHDKAKRIAGEITRKTVQAATIIGEAAQARSEETSELLCNVCGILNRGFSSLGDKLDTFNGSMDEQFVSLSDNLEYNFKEWYGYGECPDADLGLDVGELPETRLPLADNISDDSDTEETSGPTKSSMVRNTDSENANLSLFAKLANAIKVPLNVGRELDLDLAHLINLLFETPPTMEEFFKLEEEIKRPSNAEQLQVAPVPEAIWRKVSTELKGKDKMWQRLHSDFLLFIIKMLFCLDDLHKLLPVCPDIRSTVEEMTEGFKIAAFVHKVGFIDHRWEALKPDLPIFPHAPPCSLGITWNSQ